jgi:ATP-dependent 26S proteasome regulatory subunit
MLDLLNQLDRFDVHTDVILATNHTESLDPALLQPGRIDQKFKFLVPDIKTEWRIFQMIHSHIPNDLVR